MHRSRKKVRVGRTPPAVTRIGFRSITVFKPRSILALTILSVLFGSLPCVAEEPGFAQRPQPWRRRDKPILSALTTSQSWSRVTLYSPHVIRVGGKYRMWYIGNSSATRRADLVLGLAESDDGIRWREYEHNPILKLDDLPWGSCWQTPFVMFDQDENIYKMWFVSITGVKTNDDGRMIAGTQKLGYATSPDGVRWKIHPKPIFEYGRSPCVIKEGAGRYRMWMNSGPLKDGKRTGLLQHIYEFTSTDGLHWKQAEKPAVRPAGEQQRIVYPFVVKENGRYAMWSASHMPSGKTEIFCDESRDGSIWTPRRAAPAFSPSQDRKRFDSRYTSTPCILVEKDRYLLYYSARNLSNVYIDGEGNKRRDGAGVYHHIGVAVWPRR